MPGPHSLAQPKPERRRTVKARKARAEAKVKAFVRAQVTARDGYCRVGQVAHLLTPCDGPSEWAHMAEKRRSKTRGQAPEMRHTTAGSLMLCRSHHAAYDGHRLTITALTNRGADGTLRVRGTEPVSVLSVPHP